MGEADITEIGGEELSVLMESSATLVVDVRELSELPKLNPKVIRQVPMSKFNTYLQTDIPQKNIVLLCQHGIRSVTAAEALNDKYGNTKNIYSLKGGIAKWQNYLKEVQR
ncbi:MAG: hypothetical protein EOO90_18695 [Pedobacter sp.]|nr:MAG: hypothetical protein EOO90_18695 [Pedobacter sp.]